MATKTKEVKQVTLRRIGLVKTQYNVRSNGDARYIIDRYTFEYRDNDNNEYRRSFETRRGGLIHPPVTIVQDACE